MTTATGNFAELLWPGIHDIWGHAYKDYKPLYKQIFEEKKSDKRFEKEQQVTGLPLAGVKDEGNAVTFLDPDQGFQKEYSNVTYGLGAVVTREMYEDDLYGYIKSLPKMLARSLYQTEETIHFNVLNNSFSTETSADGSAAVSGAHPLVGGGTLSNQLDTASDLTQTSLEQAIQDIREWTDDKGLKILVQPKMLVVQSQNLFNAKKILGTDYAVGSADNDINPVKGIMPFIDSPYLTDEDAWWIITDQDNGLVCYDRRGAEVTPRS